MRDNEVPSKTESGRDEIQSRARKLPTVLRSLLLMVDGQRNVAQLREVTAGLHGPANALEQLQAQGLIEVPASLAAAAAATIPTAMTAMPETAAPVAAMPVATAEPVAMASGGYAALYAQMSETVREHLGLRGYFLQLKIERCADVGELLALLLDLSSALGKARDLAFASEIEQRLRMTVQA